MTYEIYIYHKSLKHNFDRKDLNLQQRRWIEFIKYYDCSVHYHHGKVNIMMDTLSRKVARMRKMACEGSSDENKAILALIQINSMIVDQIKEAQ